MAILCLIELEEVKVTGLTLDESLKERRWLAVWVARAKPSIASR
jgi:hypothetical protein